MAFGRAFPIRAHTAHPVLTKPPVTVRAVVVSQAVPRAKQQRNPPHYAVVHSPPTPRQAPPIVVHAAVQTLGRGDAGYDRQKLINPHIVGPVIARGPPVPPAIVLSPVPRKNQLPWPPLTAAPVVAPATPNFVASAPLIVAPPARSFGGRVRLPPAVIALGRPLPAAVIVTQAIRRPYVGRMPLRVRVAKGIVSSGAAPAFVAPTAKIIGQARARATIFRNASSYRINWAPLPGPPVTARARIESQALAHGLWSGAHTAVGFLTANPPLPGPIVIGQAMRRPYIGRFPNPAQTAAGIVTHVAAPFLAPAAKIVTQAHARPGIWRGVPVSPLVAPAVIGRKAPFRPGLMVGQAIRRPYVGRSVATQPIVAGPLVSPPVVPYLAPPATIASIAVEGRALIGRSGNVLLPSLGPARPVPPAILTLQAVRGRPYVGRTVPLRPRMAPPVVAEGTPVPPATIIGYALRRGSSAERRLRDVAPAPHLAKPVLVKAGPGLVLVSQALRRPYVGRSVPLSPLVAPPRISELPPVHPPIVTSVAVRKAPSSERRLRDVPPSPHLPPPVTTKRGPGITLVSQAVAGSRSHQGRWKPQPHLAKPIVKPIPGPLPAGTFISQAVRRALQGRGVRQFELRYPPPWETFIRPSMAGLVTPTSLPGRSRPISQSGVVDPVEEWGRDAS